MEKFPRDTKSVSFEESTTRALAKSLPKFVVLAPDEDGYVKAVDQPIESLDEFFLTKPA